MAAEYISGHTLREKQTTKKRKEMVDMILFIRAIIAYVTKPTAREGIKADLQYLLDNVYEDYSIVFVDAKGKEIHI